MSYTTWLAMVDFLLVNDMGLSVEAASATLPEASPAELFEYYRMGASPYWVLHLVRALWRTAA